ncbi:MAG: hypothetical protein HQ478_06155 [Chloroflexi bacterium]|nr:hypothetical protein [Chloroflexota bacterium]
MNLLHTLAIAALLMLAAACGSDAAVSEPTAPVAAPTTTVAQTAIPAATPTITPAVEPAATVVSTAVEQETPVPATTPELTATSGQGEVRLLKPADLFAVLISKDDLSGAFIHSDSFDMGDDPTSRSFSGSDFDGWGWQTGADTTHEQENIYVVQSGVSTAARIFSKIDVYQDATGATKAFKAENQFVESSAKDGIEGSLAYPLPALKVEELSGDSIGDEDFRIEIEAGDEDSCGELLMMNLIVVRARLGNSIVQVGSSEWGSEVQLPVVERLAELLLNRVRNAAAQ